MFLSASRLPHVLSPASYWSPEQYDREQSALLRSAWHLVGTQSDLAKPGDFLTCELFGRPIQVRNFDGQLRAMSNVCAHRHCMITSLARGTTAQMQCQYHGWEYNSEGRACKIPEPKNFAPLDRDSHRLPVYRVARCGQLVFVCLDPHAPELRDQLRGMYEECEKRFGPDWRRFLAWDCDYHVNWKIPIENSLEAYHVPHVHPRTFRDDPGEQNSRHIIHDTHTAFATQLPFSPHSRIDRWFQRSENWLMRRLGEAPTGEYWQYHVFPNLLFSFTDAISLCHCVIPTGPTDSRAVVRQFGRVGGRTGPRRWLARLWGRLKASITRKILAEDLALFPAIQSGLRASQQPGVLGRCEERIHAFQVFVDRALNSGIADPPDALVESFATEVADD